MFVHICDTDEDQINARNQVIAKGPGIFVVVVKSTKAIYPYLKARAALWFLFFLYMLVLKSTVSEIKHFFGAHVEQLPAFLSRRCLY